MALFDPNNSNLGQMAEAVPAAQKAFQDSLNSASLPQKLYYEALMNKVNLARQTNPIDYNLINTLANNQMSAINNFMGKGQQNGGQNGEEMKQTPNEQIIAAAAKGHPGALSILSQHNPKASPRDLVIGARSGAIGADDMMLTHQGPSPKPQDIPDELTQPATSSSGDNMSLNLTAPAQPPQLDLSDPDALKKMAGNINPAQIPSAATEDILKSVLSSQAMANRYIPSTYGRIAAEEMSVNQKEKSDQRKADTAIKVQNIKSGEYAGSEAPLSDKERAQTFKDSFGEFLKDPYLIQPGAKESLAATIAATQDPTVKAMALARPQWKKAYDASLGQPTPQGAVTPQKNANADDLIQKARTTALGQGYQQMIDPTSGRPRPTLPIGVATRLKQALSGQGVPQTKISQFLNEFILVPGGQ